MHNDSVTFACRRRNPHTPHGNCPGTPGTAFLEIETEDGPWIEVGHYGDQVQVRFDWHGPNQRWYLTPAEARNAAAALMAAAEHVSGLVVEPFEAHTASALNVILAAGMEAGL